MLDVSKRKEETGALAFYDLQERSLIRMLNRQEL